MTDRPHFLQHNKALNASELVASFRTLPKTELAEIDQWLLANNGYSSLTWQEVYLFNWINDSQDADGLFSI